MTNRLLLLLPALLASACSASTEREPAPIGTHADLLACDIPLSCEAICAHLGRGDCGGGEAALECAGALWLDGTSGVLVELERPGPGNWAADRLTLLLGDGTAVRQMRSQTCVEITPCNTEEEPWTIDEQEVCDVSPPPADCTEDSCARLPVLENCVALAPEWSCADAAAALAP
jgi:hypothetical protein